MPNTQVETLIKRFEHLHGINANWRHYFEELASYCLPRKAWINSPKTRGEKLKFNFLYDSTAIRGLKIMAAGFHSNLTNPSSKWFNMRTRDIRIMDLREVQLWFKEVEDIMFATLNTSNFDSTMQEFYLSAGCFGTGTIFTQEDFKDKVRFTEIPIEQLLFEEDSNGRINRVYRRFRRTAQQAFDLWGKAAGQAVTESIEKDPNKELFFLHIVGDRDSFDATKEDNINMPFASIWIELSKKHLISEGGFIEFPYAAGRFYKDTNDVFGYSPAMDVLADTKLINMQTKTMLRAAMKQSDPALVLPDKGFILPLNLNPGATNYRKGKATKADDISQVPSDGNIPITLEVMNRVQDNIDKAFFVPLFQALSNVTKAMTVPEVQRRISENMVLLGPVVGRFTQEVLDPILIRVFSILLRNGELPEPPAALQGADLDIVYVSPLARAQREGEVFSIESFLADVNAIAGTIPSVIDKIDGDKVVDVIGQVKGISPELIRSDKDVMIIREARAAEQAEIAQAAAMQQAAETVATGAKAAKDLKEEK
jgi:hypothetical protein